MKNCTLKKYDGNADVYFDIICKWMDVMYDENNKEKIKNILIDEFNIVEEDSEIISNALLTNNFTPDFKVDKIDSSQKEESIIQDLHQEDNKINVKSRIISNRNLGNIYYEKWSNDFNDNIVKRLLFDKDNLTVYDLNSIDYEYNIDTLNANIIKWKQELLNTISELTGNEYIINSDMNDKEFTELINSALRDFENYVKFNRNINTKYYQAYYTLDGFDQLLKNNIDFISIKNKYVNNSEKGLSMYDWIGPQSKLDATWTKSEYSNIEKYTSSFIKIFTEYFNEVDSDGEVLPSKIGFKKFNNAISVLVEWAKESGDTDVIKEIDKDIDCNWGIVIDKFLSDWKNINYTLNSTLRGIAKFIYGKNRFGYTFPEFFRNCFNAQIKNTVRTNFVEYKLSNDNNGEIDLKSITLKEGYVNKRNLNIRKNTSMRIYAYRQFLQDEYNNILKEFGIEISKIDDTNYEIRFKANIDNTLLANKTDDKDGDFVINASFVNNKWNLSDNANVKDKRSIVLDDKNIIRLAQRLKIMDSIPDIKTFYSICEALNITGNNKAYRVLSYPLALTLFGAHKESGNNVESFPFDKNKKLTKNNYANLMFYQSDFMTVASFDSILNGVDELITNKNASGNSVPGFQLPSSIYDFKNIVNDLNNLELNPTNVFAKNDFCKNINILGKIHTRLDIDILGNIKESNQLSVDEVSQLAIVCDVYNRLIDSDNKSGSILFQPITFADKKTHFLVEILTNNLSISRGYTLFNALKDISGENKDNARNKIFQHVRYVRAEKLISQLQDVISRYSNVINKKKLENPELKSLSIDEKRENQSWYDYAKESLRTIQKYLQTLKDSKELEIDFKNAGQDLTNFYDYVEYKQDKYKLSINDVLLNNVELYLKEDNKGWNNEYFNRKIQAAINADLIEMIDNNIILSSLRNPALKKSFANIYTQSVLSNGNEWYDPISQDAKIFRVKRKNKDNKYDYVDVNKFNYKDYLKTNLSEIDSNIEVELNPIFETYFLLNLCINEQFNDILFGDTLAYDIKSSTKGTHEFIDKVLENGDNILKYCDEFQLKEAERCTMKAKRTVPAGATRFTYSYGDKYSKTAPKEINVAVIDDVRANFWNITGESTDEIVADGAGIAHPIMSILENESLYQNRVGRNKKTIYHYTSGNNGIMHELKWAEFILSNDMRRNWNHNTKNSAEIMFKLMSNMNIDDISKLDFNDIYNLNKSGKYVINKRIYRFDPKSGKYFALDRIDHIDGNQYNIVWKGLDKNKNIVNDEEYVIPATINNLYDIDQAVGGAWVMEMDETTKELIYSNINNELLTNVVCNYGWKDKFVAFAVNKSAIKVGQTNINRSDVFSNPNNTLRTFKMLSCYGGVQMDADHDINYAEVTEMSQMISALIQRGNAYDLVEQIYSDIGEVAATALESFDAAIKSGNPNDVFREIGKALMDTFSSGNKETIGLAQAFIRKAEQALKDKNLKVELPLSAETITPIFFNTVGAMINKRGIKRKYAGMGAVQVPSYGLMFTYGNGMRYEDVCEEIRSRNFVDGVNWNSIEELMSNIISPNTGVKNPLIGESETDWQETPKGNIEIDETIVYQDKNGNFHGPVVLSTQKDYDYYRNLSQYDGIKIYKWKYQPKELSQGYNKFTITKRTKNGEVSEIFNIFDLDSVRASFYINELLKIKNENDLKEFNEKKIEIIKKCVERLEEDLPKQIIDNIDTITKTPWDKNNTKYLNVIKEVINNLVRKDMISISDSVKTGKTLLGWQEAFGELEDNGEFRIEDVTKKKAEIIIGRKNAAALGLRKGDSLYKIKKQGVDFFYNRLTEQYKSIDTLLGEAPEDIQKLNPEAIAQTKNGNKIVIIKINEDKDKEGFINKLEKSRNYSLDSNGKWWYNNEQELFDQGTKEFYRIKDTDFDCIVIKDFSDLDDINGSDFIDLVQINYNSQNIEEIINFYSSEDQLENIDVKNAEDWAKKEFERSLKKLAKQRYESFLLQLQYIGARIPTQSMQSFMDLEVVGFTDDDINSVYVPRQLTWLEGSDFDIDKLYLMGYSINKFGQISTQTNLDKLNIFSYKDLLTLPMPNGAKFEQATIEDINNKEYIDVDAYISNHLNAKYIDVLKYILEENKKTGISKIVLNDTDTISSNKVLKYLTIHSNTKLNKERKEQALRNIVVNRIHKVCEDPSTQVDAQLPISMDESRAAGEKNQSANKTKTMNWDCSLMKFELQYQNMVGRTVIATVAVSLKSYFALLDSCNNTINRLYDINITNGDDLESNLNSLREFLLELANITFLGKNNKLLTITNINFNKLIDKFKGNGEIIIPKFDKRFDEVINIPVAAGSGIYSHYVEVKDGITKFKLLELLKDLQKSANGPGVVVSDPNSSVYLDMNHDLKDNYEYKTIYLDAAMSLSGLLSAATDSVATLRNADIIKR